MKSAQKKYKSKFDRKNYDPYQTLTLILTQERGKICNSRYA